MSNQRKKTLASVYGHKMRRSVDGRVYCDYCCEMLTSAAATICPKAATNERMIVARFLLQMVNPCVSFHDIKGSVQEDLLGQARDLLDILEHYRNGSKVPTF